VVRERVVGRSECRIVYSRLADPDADDVVRGEMALARDGGYTLEWKLYGHDLPTDLAERLLAAGFEAGDLEQVLMLPVDDRALAAFGTPAGCEVRRVRDEAGLADYAEIAREIGRRQPQEEQQELAAVLRRAPDTMSVHVAYVDGEPVAGGRIHFRAGGSCAELAGGRTKTAHRGRGLFTAVVGARLREARVRGRELVLTDALPTSEPILTRHGFRRVTSTRPFVYRPAS
jgi:GNAT superfamily N-acetyltransferase